jgi:hypothetical protein
MALEYRIISLMIQKLKMTSSRYSEGKVKEAIFPIQLQDLTDSRKKIIRISGT